jgi:PAS domain S-box-containing protein
LAARIKYRSHILYASPAFETIWDRSCESLYTDPGILIDSVHPEDRVQVLVAKPSNDFKPFNQIYRILRPDGSLRWIYARTFLIYDKNREPYCIFCIAQDITDQKQVELALRDTLNRTREQFSLSHKMSLSRKPEAVLKTLMSAHELRSAHRAALLFFDNPKIGPTHGMELIASWRTNQALPPWSSELNLYEEPTLWELFQSNKTVVVTGIQSDSRLPPALRDLLLEGQIHTMVIFPLKASGNWLGSLIVYYHQEARFNHIELRHLKVLIDQATITLYNLKLLVVEEESRHEAERANEIKSEFLAMISHELRTPLTSIIGFTTTLLAKDVTWQPDEQQDFIQTIQQEADRLQELIDHLLDLSRLEAGMLPIVVKPRTLYEVVEEASPRLQTLTKGQTLIINLPSKLPMINVDAKRIAQVLVNLVRNASTYAPKATEINITANTRGNFVLINVNDLGPGIPNADHKKVFKAFIRGQFDENSTSKGAGLGLAISKGLVEAHGGRIWIRKKNTPGATVSFTVPIAPLNVPANTDGEGH